MAYGPEEAAKEVERVIDTIPNFLGFDPKADFLDALGSIVVVCDDPDQGFFGTGGTLIVQVKDAKKLRQSFEKIVDKINSFAPDEEIAKIHRAKKQGREIWHLEFGQVVQGLGIGIDENWMVIALMPQPVEAFFLRVDGKLPKWSKDQLKEAGAPVVPEKFTSDRRLESPRDLSEPLEGGPVCDGHLGGFAQRPAHAAPQSQSALDALRPAARGIDRGAVVPQRADDDDGRGRLSLDLVFLAAFAADLRRTRRRERAAGHRSFPRCFCRPFSNPASPPAAANPRTTSSNWDLAMHNYHDTHQFLPGRHDPQ